MGSGAAHRVAADEALEPEKLFKCPVCSRVFNKKANLKVHSRKHTGEKPYACSKPGCGRAFMWKSSVTFHEQNCPSAKKDPAPPNSISVATKGVQKRPKSSTRPPPPADHRDWPPPPSRTPPAHRARKRAAKPAAPPLPTTPITPDDAARERDRDAARIRDDLALSPNGLPKHPAHPQHHLHHPPPAPLPAQQAAQRQGLDALHAAAAYSPQPLSVSPLPVSPAPPAQTLGFLTGAESLPAPATLLLGEKRVGGGRPPIIPGSLPKHPFYTMTGPKDNAKPLFDLRVPASTSVPSGGKPPGMYNTNKMPKMPIAMELDDSDDEGAGKIIGAQDAFMRTGDPFRGFVPPTRCSPLPVSSPIVCPGISPMPLSPLAPFSPLPPDSPAHNAPNPVHPPLNQPMRPANTNW